MKRFAKNELEVKVLYAMLSIGRIMYFIDFKVIRVIEPV